MTVTACVWFGLWFFSPQPTPPTLFPAQQGTTLLPASSLRPRVPVGEGVRPPKEDSWSVRVKATPILDLEVRFVSVESQCQSQKELKTLSVSSS